MEARPYGGKATGPPCPAPNAMAGSHTQGLEATLVPSHMGHLWCFESLLFLAPIWLIPLFFLPGYHGIHHKPSS